MKHTPGPWTAWGTTIRANKGDYVASAKYYPIPGVDDDNSDANARLIAAAPELLEACKGVLALFASLTIQPNGDHDNPETDPAYIVTFGELAKLRAAIEKAEGQS